MIVQPEILRLADDVAYEIAVRRSIERGLADLEAGRTFTREALLESFGLDE